MSDEYTLRFFREHYIEHRGVPAVDQDKIREAFMGGAHTLLLMFTNAMQSERPEVLMRQLTQELNEFMLIRGAMAEADKSVVH